jgi:hypothetical protein
MQRMIYEMKVQSCRQKENIREHRSFVREAMVVKRLKSEYCCILGFRIRKSFGKRELLSHFGGVVERIHAEET